MVGRVTVVRGGKGGVKYGFVGWIVHPTPVRPGPRYITRIITSWRICSDSPFSEDELLQDIASQYMQICMRNYVNQGHRRILDPLGAHGFVPYPTFLCSLVLFPPLISSR